MDQTQKTIAVVGSGLAGSECALQLADKGYKVVLFEMRKSGKLTPAHKTQRAAELVCSNSFGSLNEVSAPGSLKWEAEALGSHVLEAAKNAYVPAGQALGVDRDLFSIELDKKVIEHENITVSPEEIKSLDEIPRPAVIATGPLTALELSSSMALHFGDEFLYFFDAIAPIVDTDSIDMSKAWKADRWNKGEGDGDYINCPMTKEEYEEFVEAIAKSDKVEAKEFEKNTPFFEGCMPIEETVRRGPDTPRFGCMSPKGLPYPGTDKWPYAVVQLRQDNKAGTSYNIVGFQTKMTYSEQKRVFRKIPGLENAEFLKLGSIHRNLYINSTKKLNEDLSSKADPLLFFAGQITGVEGYFESTCIGLLVSRFVDAKINGLSFNPPPRQSAMGSLLYAITGEEKENFQPTNINFGLFPPLDEKVRDKKLKKAKIIERAQIAFRSWLGQNTNIAPNRVTRSF